MGKASTICGSYEMVATTVVALTMMTFTQESTLDLRVFVYYSTRSQCYIQRFHALVQPVRI